MNVTAVSPSGASGPTVPPEMKGDEKKGDQQANAGATTPVFAAVGGAR